MKVSRIDKLINEITRAPSLASSADARTLPFNIVLSAEIEPTKRAMMAHIATTIALRCFHGPIVLHGDPEWPGLSFERADLGGSLLAIAQAFGRPERVRWSAGAPAAGPLLRIGAGAGGSGHLADASGWIAGINVGMPTLVPAEAAACAFAVSCAFAQIFASVVLGMPRHEAWTFSVLDHRAGFEGSTFHELQPLDLGSVGLLGAGAIGSAFAYALRLSHWTADLQIFDRETYDEPNIETTCLIHLDHVRRCAPKAVALAEVSRRPGLIVEGVRTEIDASSPELMVPRQVFVCGVDNPDTRRELDRTRADALLNAAVGGGALDAGHVLFTRHLASDPPLSARYPARDRPATAASTAHVPIELRDQCSRVSYEGVSVAAPFIAVAAGAMLAGACAAEARRVPRETRPNYLKLDVFELQRQLITRHDPRRPAVSG
jgi:hypothetical protein